MPEPKAEPDVLLYLDRLRDSGVTNMFGAGRYVQKAFPRRTPATWWLTGCEPSPTGSNA